MKFQEKAKKIMMNKLKSNQQTTVIASHSMKLINEICNKAILIHKKKILAIGSPDDVCKEHISLSKNLK